MRKGLWHGRDMTTNQGDGIAFVQLNDFEIPDDAEVIIKLDIDDMRNLCHTLRADGLHAHAQMLEDHCWVVPPNFELEGRLAETERNYAERVRSK